MKTRNVTVRESVTVKDKIHTYKVWIGKLKHFFTVKVNPPVQK
jgi:hypothetical protein